jgi:hypothetical protein
VCLLTLAAPARAAYQALEEIPVESPVYRWVEDLAASYGTAGAYLGEKPWDRADLACFLDRLVAASPAAAGDPALLRLRRELTPGDAVGAWRPLGRGESDTGSLEASPYARADYAEDRARGGIVRDFRAGLQLSAALSEGALLYTDFFAGTNSPGPHGNPTDSRHFGLIEGVELNSYFDRAYGTFRGRLGRLHVGHTWLRWGPGFTGGVALSDGAPAMDLAEARVPLLRDLQLSWFVATLDPALEQYLAGHRLAFRPTAATEFSLSELARFDGTRNAPLYLLPVIPYSLIEKRIIKSSTLPSDSLEELGKNNVLWAADAAWRVRAGLRLYGEVAVDDISFSSEKRPRALAWLAGGHWRRASGRDAWTLRGEYARVYRFTYSVFHHHDFAFAGYPTGYPLGPDAERAAGRLEWRRGAAWTLGAEGSLTRKGEGALGDFYVPGSGAVDNLPLSGVVERDARGALSADYSPAPGLSLGVTAGHAAIDHRAHVRGAGASGLYGSTRATLRW